MSTMSLSRDVALAALDSELSALEEGLVMARRRRNLRTAVQSLPAEVLTMVFAEAQVGWIPRRVCTEALGSPVPKIRYEPGWMALVHVCSAWSKSILSTPSLWCDVHCLSLHPRSVLRILSLSNGLELSLTIAIEPPVDHAHIEQMIDTWLCGPVLRRTNRLAFMNYSQGLVDICLPYLCHPMPSLTDFTLESLEEDEEEWPDFLPANLFAQRCPRLSSISLKNRILPWHSPLLSEKIVQLKIGFGDASELDSAMPSMSRLLDLLQSMPVLEVLALHQITPTPSTSSTDMRQVTLPRLFKSLVVSVHVYRTGYFDLFRHLVIPNDAIAAAEIMSSDSLGQEAMDGLLSDMPHLFRIADDYRGDAYFELDITRTMLSLHYRRDAPCSTLTTCLLRPHPWSTLQNYEPPCGRHIWIHDDDDDEDIDSSTVLTYLPRLPLHVVECCTFTREFMFLRLCTAEWHSHFSAASNTRHISLSYFEGRELLSALADTRDADEEESPESRILFPKLETIVLHVIPFMDDAELQNPADCAALDVLLFELVRIRQSWQTPLREIFAARVLSSRTHLWEELAGMVAVKFF